MDLNISSEMLDDTFKSCLNISYSIDFNLVYISFDRFLNRILSYYHIISYLNTFKLDDEEALIGEGGSLLNKEFINL